MWEYEDIECLSVELPEDILKKKWYGDFEGAKRLIDIRTAQPIPEALKKKLLLEKQIIDLLPGEYPYSYDEALAMVRERIPEFTGEEFQQLQDFGKLDWIYVNGQPHYFRGFLDTLMSVNKSIIERAAAQRDKVKAAGERGLTGAEAAQQREDELDREKARVIMDAMHTVKEKKKLKYHYRIRASRWIDDDAFEPGEVLVHLPIPKNCEQFSNIRILSTSPKECYIAPPDAPQRTVSFRAVLAENRRFTVEYEYDSEVRYVVPDADVVAGVKQPVLVAGQAGAGDNRSNDVSGNGGLGAFGSRIEYLPIAGRGTAVDAGQKREYLVYENSVPVCVEDLSEQAPHIMFTPFLKALAAEIAGEERNPYLLAKRVYDYVTTRVTYSYLREYFTIENIAEYAALGGKGDCGVQALLFITLCRILGVPARWQSGLNANPCGITSHDWAQFYVAPYGWLFADCSFGGSGYRNGNPEKHEYYFGNLDPFRMVANSAWQKEFDPPKKFLRSDPYDNQHGEIEYADHGLNYLHCSSEREVLEAYPVFS